MPARSYSISTVAYATARSLVASAIEHATSNDWNIAVVVLDPSGFIVASGRMDGVSASIMDIATDKAYTATLGQSSIAYSARMNSSPSLKLGAANRPRFCAWEGGLPLLEDKRLIGAIGVSGAAGNEDVECARTALQALGLEDVT